MGSKTQAPPDEDAVTAESENEFPEPFAEFGEE
jgi:hypothetical protein